MSTTIYKILKQKSRLKSHVTDERDTKRAKSCHTSKIKLNINEDNDKSSKIDDSQMQKEALETNKLGFTDSNIRYDYHGRKICKNGDYGVIFKDNTSSGKLVEHQNITLIGKESKSKNKENQNCSCLCIIF